MQADKGLISHYSSETMRVVESRGESSKRKASLVTFESVRNNYEFPPQEPFAAGLAAKHKINITHALPVGSDWYQYSDTALWVDAIRKRTSLYGFAYGSSMGGYAVNRFLDRLGLTRGVCISPQFSVCRETVPFEDRWADHAARIRFTEDDNQASRKGTVWVFYDTEGKDKGHAEKIAETGPTELIPIPFGGHPVGHAMKDAGLLSVIFKMFLDGREDRAEIKRLLSYIPERSAVYHVNFARSVPMKERENIYLKGMQINAKHVGLRQAYATFLIRTNRIPEGEEILRPLVQRHHIAKRYSELCEKLNIPATLLKAIPA